MATQKPFTGPGVLTPAGPAREVGRRSTAYNEVLVDTIQQDGSLRTYRIHEVVFPANDEEADQKAA